MRNSLSARRGLTLVELLVAIAILALLAGLSLSAVQRVRQASSRSDCSNRLRQSSLGLTQHHDLHRLLPPGHRSPKNSDKLAYSGWCLSILPHLEQSSIHDIAMMDYRSRPIPFGRPRGDLDHAALSIVIPVFICPADPRVRTAQICKVSSTFAAFTSYLGVSGTNFPSDNGVLFHESRIRYAEIQDGLSNTLILGERPPSENFQYGWWYAGLGQSGTGSADQFLSVREPNVQLISSGSVCGPGEYPFMPATGFDDPCGMFHFWSPHSGGANFAFCDGSVRFLRYAANDVLPALATRAGGETVELPD